MLKTRITEKFGIKHPIMLAGMNWLTTPEIVAAVSNAGGLGNLWGGGRSSDNSVIVENLQSPPLF